MKLILLICVSAREQWCEAARDLYQTKISRFIPFEVKELKLKKSARDDQDWKKLTDSQAILAEVKPDDFVILFDERGASFDSKEFAGQLQKILNSGKKRLIFVIGGAYGVNEQVQARANLKISLSKFVFNHLIAQTVVLEQIFRAFSILKNHPYHNE